MYKTGSSFIMREFSSPLSSTALSIIVMTKPCIGNNTAATYIATLLNNTDFER